jgi:hypothetical protein
MKHRVVGAALILLSAALFPSQANAEWNGFSMLRDCKNTPSQPCIESIAATTTDGRTINAVLTGRTAVGDGTAPANIDDEYELPGLNFEAPAGDRMVARLFYDGTMFQTVFEASWLDRTPEQLKNFAILSPHRDTALNCGTTTNRVLCYRNINFNQDLTFHEVVRVPKTFVTAYVNARTDLINYKTGLNPIEINGVPYADIDLTIHVTKKAQVLFSDLLPNPLASSDWADTEIDQTIANFYTPQNPNAQRLGLCSGIPAISVISNGINPDVPIWDPGSQSLSVQVWGPHFKINGEINAGFFQARISKEIAKCLWNLDISSATKAQITLTDQGTNGVDTIETIAGNFDGKDYVLTDSNFHYSTPKISFKLLPSEKPKAEVTPSPIPSATPLSSLSPMTNSKSQLMKSLTCVQGKRIRKIVALNPTCPKGYKPTK